jgi:hypothetical protein
MEEPKGMILRWLETLSNNVFTVQFRDGKKHGNADALSRSEHARPPNEEEEKAAVEESIQAISYPEPMSADALKRKQREDPDLRKVRRWVAKNEKPDRASIRQESEELRQYRDIFETLYLNNEGILYRRRQPGEYFTNDRLCLPSSLKYVTVKACHEGTGGHMGINATQQRVVRRFYFSGIHKFVEVFVGNCIACQRKIGKAKDQRHTLFSTQEGMPFQKISIDFVGPLKSSSKGNVYLFTVKDCFSRWLEAFPIREATAEAAVEVLQHHIFARHGVPEQIHSDQGSQFTGELFQEICDLLRVERTQTPAYNPKSNAVERSHRDLNSIIRALVQETDQDWEEVLPVALLALRTARNRHTGVTPFWALHGREARLPIDIVYGNPTERQQHKTIYAYDLLRRLQITYRYMREQVHLSIERARLNYKGTLQGKKLSVGDLVFLHTPRF